MIIRVKKSILLIAAVILLFCVAMFSRGERRTTSAPQSVSIPVIMYHQISHSSKNTGKYVIAADELEKDMLYLREKGYETVSVADLINYTEGRGALPQKCVMLTFDDGYETGYTILYPLLQKYNMKAVISVIGSLTELYTEKEDHNDSYSYLDSDEIRILSQSPLVEIENHSYNMHFCESGKRKGINKLYGESSDEYKKTVGGDLEKMQLYLLKKTGVLPKAIAYPYGECCSDTIEMCKRLGFEVTFTCEEKVNTITRYRSESLMNLGRFNRSGTTDRETFFSRILK